MFYLKCLLVLLSIINSLSIQASTTLEQVGQLSLFTDKPYKVDGQYLYAAGCGGFEVFDLVDPLKPNLLANLPVQPNSGDCYSFKLSVGNSHAYLAGWQAIDIIDISTPSKPKRIGTYELPQGNTIYDFIVSGKYGYVVFTNSILVLDLTNPSKPALVGSKTFPLENNAVFIEARTNGEQLIVRKNAVVGGAFGTVGSSTDELFIFSLKDPAKFEQLGHLSLEGRNGTNMRFSTDEFQVSGQYLYVESLGNILTIDISNPAKPQQVGKYTFSDDSSWYADNIIINGNVLYFLRNNTGQEMSAQDNTHKVFALDITNPAKLTLISTYKADRDNYSEFRTVYLYKQYLRVNNLILDISQPSQIKVADTLKNTLIPIWDSTLIAKDKYVYVANSGNTFSIIDVSNPTLPKQLSYMIFDELQSSGFITNLISLAVDNNIAYLCNKLGVYTVDVSNPFQPKKIGQYLLSNNEVCGNISLFAKYAYLTVNNNNLNNNKIITLDISNPKEPVKTGEYQATDRRWKKLVANGEQLYVLAETPPVNYVYNNYLHIFNASNPATLKELSNYELPSSSSDMMSIGQTIYFSNSSNLHIVDVSNPNSPKSLGNYNNNSWRINGGLRFVQSGNNFLYASDGIGLFKLEVSNPTKPKQIAQIIPPNSNYVLAANEPYVYRLTDVSFQAFKSTEVETPQMTQIKGLANGACELNLSAKMLSADDGTGRNVGDFYLQWKETGRESTSGGDAVIAGYFYAPSEKVTWGSEANPEVYAKLWFAANGMLNVNFFHVGVFDVQLATSYGEDMPQLNGGSDLEHNKITIGRKAWRYSRHDYTNWRTCGKSNSALGSLKADSSLHNSLKDMVNNQTKFTTSVFKSPSTSAAKITGQTGSCELLIDAKMLNATSNGKPYGNLKLQWKEILRSTTSGGDTVIAGYFYGSPNEVSWGSTTNPEAYVKIWYARNGMLNVNFFHVGVFDIELTSSYKGAVPNTIDGVLNDDNNFINIWGDANRYSRHDYNNWKLCN
jgi:hypothetical protein